MTPGQILTRAWTLDPSIVIGCVALLAGYGWWVRPSWPQRGWCFVAGVGLLFIALASPLEVLGDTYLFSAHMLQHLFLLLIVPPLLLLGLPAEPVQRLLQRPVADRLERSLGYPPVAWTIGVATIWLWHIPALYNLTLVNEQVHIFEHLLFLAAATIFWWPVFSPATERRMQPLSTIPYLFGAAVASSALGILLTFATPGIYPAYIFPYDRLNILAQIRGDWGLTLAVDQQLGGLFMWVPGSLVYLFAILSGLARWYGSPEEDGFTAAHEGGT